MEGQGKKELSIIITQMKLKKLSIFFIFLSTATIFAQLNTYSYKRKLHSIGKENYYSIPLKPEITARCKSNVNDIRLYNVKENDTAEIPYLMEWMGTTNEQT